MQVKSSSAPRVLVVSTDRLLAEDVYRVLTREGHDVFLADAFEEASVLTKHVRPHLVIVDFTNSPERGAAFCRHLRARRTYPSLLILVLIGSHEIAERVAALEAGGDDYIVKPFHPDELLYRAKSLLVRGATMPISLAPGYEWRGRVVACFGSKGGVGTTTVAVNCAIALRRLTSSPVVLVDADLHFGDVGIHLDLSAPPDMSHLLDHVDHLSPLVIQRAVQQHISGIHVLLSPTGPERARSMTAEHMATILSVLSAMYDYVLVDCHAGYDDPTMAVLSEADDILFVLTPEISPIHNASSFLHAADRMGVLPSSVRLVLNRVNSNANIGTKEVERFVKVPVAFRLVSSGRHVVQSITRGVPMVMGEPSHPFSEQIVEMARALVTLGVTPRLQVS
ncbi:MAG: response regulator [Ardenticatenia bacterium]|nr:response regulator [Ardenticatenia bacterium]